MNLSAPLRPPTRLIYRIAMKGRRFLPKQKSRTFGLYAANGLPRIGEVFVVNLDRQQDRWREITRELARVVDSSGESLTSLLQRHPAVDASDFSRHPPVGGDLYPFYTLRDQLLVEPQPSVLPDRIDLDRPIPMSRPEIAVALSHIGVWRRIAAGDQSFALVLEDDIYFRPGFARYFDQAWVEIGAHPASRRPFDILYVSYKEVKHGAQKTLLSPNLFRPLRGLWYMSGYVLSREGAEKLLRLLPCRGPVDLWINQQFARLNVLATRRSLIAQRWDAGSTNSYSVLPALTRIGAIDSERAALFLVRPTEKPVFAFGPEGSGLTSLAMALSMLGYRCCSDLRHLPESELEQLLKGSGNRIFDAYVNIGALAERAAELGELYPGAKFIATSDRRAANDASADHAGHVPGLQPAVLRRDEPDKWKVICEHLRCAPPLAPFPETADLGQRELLSSPKEPQPAPPSWHRKRDRSPWIVDDHPGWQGIHSRHLGPAQPQLGACVKRDDSLAQVDRSVWLPRDDTFPGNLALFRPTNVEVRPGTGVALLVRSQPLSVRHYSAAAISSRDRFLFGRFEVVLQASDIPGIVTGFFLHRDSPRQEIDVEIFGNQPNRLLLNVFYNPGDEGANYDYGYRGAPSQVALGFDASKAAHRFVIDWGPSQIRWLVDGELIHRRVDWDPTPIPRLPMTLHVNTWPSRSKELAGRLNSRLLPATTILRSITVDATLASIEPAFASRA